MADIFDLIIQNGTLVNHDGRLSADVGVRDGCVAVIGDLKRESADQIIDATGLHVLPGVIDTQVHFREPGMEWKEDLETGSRGAVLGGVTGVFEMPNTKPTTSDEAAIADKVSRATNRMFCDFAFYAGATEHNVDRLGILERTPGCCGVKVFMGSSTGSLLMSDDEGLEAVLRNINRRAAFHSEDEERLLERRPLAELGNVHTHPVWRDDVSAMRATERLLALVRKTQKRAHILHISTAQEMHLLAEHKDLVSVETTPQHLTLAAPECYDDVGTFAQMNPPIRDAQHREGIWRGLTYGIVDVLGSDHAPHTREEKAKSYPASPAGMPGVQTLVPIMLNHINAGRLSLERFVDLMCHGPNRLFGIAGKGRLAVGYDADFTLVDMKAQRTITDDWIASTCGWTPFHGWDVVGWPKGTIIRGQRVMWEDEILGAAIGQPMRFQDTMSDHI